MSPAARAPRAAAPPRLTYTFETDWEPHSNSQRSPLLSFAQIIDLTCGRRWGKTDLGESWLTGIHPDAKPGNNGAVWVPESRNLYTAPNYRPNCVDFYEGLKKSLWGHIKDKSDSELWIQLKHNNATLQCLQLERFEGQRGIQFDRLFFDEKGTTPAKAWYNVLGPVLADPPERCVRRVMRAGTARGKKNWTYREHLSSVGSKDRGIFGREAFVFPTWYRPGTERYVADMRLALPENVIRQELGAEFLDETAGFFQRWNYTGATPPTFDSGAKYTAGVDLAHSEDFTIVLILRAKPRPMVPVAMLRFGRQPWGITKARIVEVLRQWNADALIDATPGGSPGEVTVEAFRPEWTRIAGFDSRSEAGAGRESMLQHLCVLLEQGGVVLPGTKEAPAFPQLTLEIEGFEYEILANGRARAAAGVGPDGERLPDDCVIALALATWRARSVGGYVSGIAAL